MELSIIKALENQIENKKKSQGFRLFFLGKNECDVEVFEVKKIDFKNIKKRLDNGDSIFMTAIAEVN